MFYNLLSASLSLSLTLSLFLSLSLSLYLSVYLSLSLSLSLCLSRCSSGQGRKQLQGAQKRAIGETGTQTETAKQARTEAGAVAPAITAGERKPITAGESNVVIASERKPNSQTHKKEYMTFNRLMKKKKALGQAGTGVITFRGPSQT